MANQMPLGLEAQNLRQRAVSFCGFLASNWYPRVCILGNKPMHVYSKLGPIVFNRTYSQGSKDKIRLSNGIVF